LAAGDALQAHKHVSLRDDPPALALRGIAMAQLGEHARARDLLRRAARGLGLHDLLARSRCTVAEAWPGAVERECLIARAFHLRKVDETHRARLRVEIGRLRAQVAAHAGIETTTRGFVPAPYHDRGVAVLAPPLDGDQDELLALLADGTAWSTSALALALGVNQRSGPRACGRPYAGTALAGATPDGFHDDLVAPRSTAASVDCHPASHGRPTARRAKRESTMSLDEPSANLTHDAEIVREYGPSPGAACVAGMSFDGQRVWAATGTSLMAFDPASGETARQIDRAADAGTAFDGAYLYQIAEVRIDKIDPATCRVVASIPAPGQVRVDRWRTVARHLGERRE
jgi:hypothetical protein